MNRLTVAVLATFVVILVGSGNLENCKCDDVWFRSDTSFHWLIKSVEVRVRP